MKRELLISIVVGLVFSDVRNCSFARNLVRTKYRYTVAWDYWDDSSNPRSSENWIGMDVRLNGKSIGQRTQAFEKLEGLPVKKGEHVKLEMPARGEGYSPGPGHSRSSFLQRWMEKGALADWHEGDKQYLVHTVSYTDFMTPDGLVRDMDLVTWIVDGIRIGKGDAMLRLVEKWSGSKGLVIEILIPLNWNSEYFIPARPGDSLDMLELLNNNESIRVFWITPEKYPDSPPRSFGGKEERSKPGKPEK